MSYHLRLRFHAAAADVTCKMQNSRWFMLNVHSVVLLIVYLVSIRDSHFRIGIS